MRMYGTDMRHTAASADRAEASYLCARSASAHIASQMMDAIMMASIIITISLILCLSLVSGLLRGVLPVAVLLSVLVLPGYRRAPKNWA